MKFKIRNIISGCRLAVWLINLRSWKVARANRDLKRAMHKDPDFAHVWQCNIAMPILDGADGKLTLNEANEIADRLMEHLFDVMDTTSKTP